MALVLTVIAVAYNNVINRWPAFHSWAYVPVNLLVASTFALFATVASDLSPEELGLHVDVSDLVVPVVLVALFAVVAIAIARSRHAHRIADKRVTGMQGRALAYYTLVRIPFGTAVTEELLFRGVLHAAWVAGGASDLLAGVCASIAFGLWHVAPTVIGLRLNDPAASRTKVRAAVAGAILFTTLAGLALTWLRVETGGLLAPIVLHAGVNSVGALAAAVANRRVTVSVTPLL